MRGVVAVLVAMVLGFLIITGIEWVSHGIYPPPTGIDLTRPDVLATLMLNAPVGALLFIALAHFLAALAGNLTALAINHRKRLPAYIFSGLLIGGTAANLWMIPHPVWFMVVDLVGVMLALFLVFRFVKAPSK